MRNKKKGFTLVELIVVMGIIAILAAVIAPTTIHFIEKAHESNDKVLIDISNNISIYFGSFVSSNDSNVDITTSIDNNKLVNLIESDPNIKIALPYITEIKFIFNNVANNSCDVDVQIYGKKEAKNIQMVERHIYTSINVNNIFMDLDTIPESISYIFNKGKIIEIK